MKKIFSSVIGVDQGDVLIFSDFDSGGSMWTGKGQRARRVRVDFPTAFREEPSVHVSLKMMDMAQNSNQRFDLLVEEVSEQGFTAIFKTWGDTKIARASMHWLAIGPTFNDDDWVDID
ncbi:hypothetical protein GCM10007939_23530 [Amylibacter marinus]|uniref:H-type lectin domain-containing protein n=1 Tax=Amylibacter marinus TaxID=1475483 RepID=A0ABQ5VXQ6_9RHOB|nr:H-type lectin domain-containing protein [Amylibacter marinus]GLQ36069.1 hypothetical protein GCM10007939_23530 [Amylibacter marinus]